MAFKRSAVRLRLAPPLKMSTLTSTATISEGSEGLIRFGPEPVDKLFTTRTAELPRPLFRPVDLWLQFGQRFRRPIQRFVADRQSIGFANNSDEGNDVR